MSVRISVFVELKAARFPNFCYFCANGERSLRGKTTIDWLQAGSSLQIEF